MSYFYGYNDGDGYHMLELFEEPECQGTYQNEYGVVTATLVIGVVDGYRELTTDATCDSNAVKILESESDDFIELGWFGDVGQAEWRYEEIINQRLLNQIE